VNGQFPLKCLTDLLFPLIDFSVIIHLCPEKLFYNLVFATPSVSRISPSPRNSYSNLIKKVNRYQFSARGHE